jgi:hypothetical protein
VSFELIIAKLLGIKKPDFSGLFSELFFLFFGVIPVLKPVMAGYFCWSKMRAYSISANRTFHSSVFMNFYRTSAGAFHFASPRLQTWFSGIGLAV